MNFYEETLLEINELISKKEYDNALQIINTELNMPYVPTDFEKKLLDIRNEILFNKETTKGNNIDPEKLFLLLNSDNLELFEKIGLIKQLEDINLRKYTEKINELLISSKTPQELKTMIFYILVEQQINAEVKFENNWLNKVETLNPSNVDLAKYEMVPMEIIKEISDEIYHKNVQLFEMAKQLTVTAFYKLFPFVNGINLDSMKEAILITIFEINGLVYNKQSGSEKTKEYLELLKRIEVA